MPQARSDFCPRQRAEASCDSDERANYYFQGDSDGRRNCSQYQERQSARSFGRRPEALAKKEIMVDLTAIEKN